MRTLRLRTGSLHACSIGKKTRQAGPAQQNNQTFTLGGYVNKRIRLFLWLSSLSSAERKVIDTIKLLQSWVVKKKKKERKKKKTRQKQTNKQQQQQQQQQQQRISGRYSLPYLKRTDCA